ncbi:MAG: hypothetical protein ACP5E5_07425 [Acidobacteriaceae bacterium]
MRSQTMRRALLVYLALLVPIGWLAMKYSPYAMDGDGMAYMDIADLMRTHHWAAVVNGYWNPLYPACMALFQWLFHTTRWNELHAYYVLNYFIFLASVVVVLLFVSALVKLRHQMNPLPTPLLGIDSLSLLGAALTVIAAQRELSMAFMRPDALLQALMLLAFAMLLQSLATTSLVYPPLLGLFLGLAYLAKSFAFVVAFLCIAAMMLFQVWVQRRRPARILAAGALALLVFAAVVGPYIAALSRQKHRFDFGDSGALNYAWYVSGTVKMHLEPWMTTSFGSARVHLIHPEQQLLAHPGIYSYRAEPYGTYPAWFDPTYFHERITPVFNARRLFRRDMRNLVLSVRYLFNHPEAWILLALLLVCGARLDLPGLRGGRADWRAAAFSLPALLLGVAMWGIYALVNVEERYVTLAYLAIVLPLFAALDSAPEEPAVNPAPARQDISAGISIPAGSPALLRSDPAQASSSWQRRSATAMVALLAFLALGESLRIAFEQRRDQSAAGLPAAWYSPNIFAAAHGLQALGVGSGDSIACMGTIACLNDPYWMRLADVRVLTEVYNPDPTHLMEEFQGLPNRSRVLAVLKAQGAKVLVAAFDPGAVTGRTPASGGWIRLGESDLYALPLNLPTPPPAVPVTLPWDSTGAAKP